MEHYVSAIAVLFERTHGGIFEVLLECYDKKSIGLLMHSYFDASYKYNRERLTLNHQSDLNIFSCA